MRREGEEGDSSLLTLKKCLGSKQYVEENGWSVPSRLKRAPSNLSHVYGKDMEKPQEGESRENGALIRRLLYNGGFC